jgi:peptidoglycan-N-acetylglucosamine deacetylase
MSAVFRRRFAQQVTQFAPRLMFALLPMLLLLAACQSPSEYEVSDAATTPSETNVAPTETPVPTSHATDSPIAVTAIPTATATSPPPIAPTSAPSPTSTSEPTSTTEPVSTNTPQATQTSTPSAADVWNLRQFDTDEKVIVLTFDAGADTGFAADILDTLAAEGIHASFGMTGSWAEQNPELIERIVNEGHHLINHSWSHPHFPELTSAERIAELHDLENLIRDTTGVELQPYFRPPFGEFDDATLADLAANGYTINVLWTIDTLGWKGLSADEITTRVLDGAAPGAIVLMHVGSQSQDAAALPQMIQQLRDQGYSFASVEELVNRS